MTSRSQTKTYLFTLFAALIGTGLWLTILNQAYPFVVASDEATSSLTVSAEHQAEMKGAKNVSDLIGFSILGGIVALIVVSVSWIRWRSPTRIGLHHLLTALVSGGIAGAIAGAIGNWIEASPNFNIADPMMFQFARLLLMFAPLALVTGALTSFVTPSRESIAVHPIGAVLGLALSLFIYSVLSGTVTAIEGREFVLPHHSPNRFMLMALVVFGISLGISLSSNSKCNSSIEDAPDVTV